MEEGEITDPYAYDPCYEWPGDEDIEISPLPKRSRRPICRFVVSRTAVLPAQHRIVSADDYTEIQFGRDAQFGAIPRVRLKEMQVSKLHATAYWDPARKEWNVVDMGSKHADETLWSSIIEQTYTPTTFRLLVHRKYHLPCAYS